MAKIRNLSDTQQQIAFTEYDFYQRYVGMPYNMTETEHYIWGLPFTRQLVFGCPEGTIQSTLKNNPYMKLPISKWKTNGAKERVLLLAEKLIAKLKEK